MTIPLFAPNVIVALNKGGHFAANGIAQQVTVNVAGSNVTVRFIVHNGIPKIGTMFIP